MWLRPKSWRLHHATGRIEVVPTSRTYAVTGSASGLLRRPSNAERAAPTPGPGRVAKSGRRLVDRSALSLRPALVEARLASDEDRAIALAITAEDGRRALKAAKRALARWLRRVSVTDE